MNIRHLTQYDAGQLQGHLLRLDPESRRLRFGCPVSDEPVLAYTASIRWLQMLAIGAFDDSGILRGVCQLVQIDADSVELGISVEAAWRGDGLGHELVDRALTYARNRGVRLVRLQMLAENVQMRALLPDATFRMAEDGIIEADIPLDAAAIDSVTREWSETMLGSLQTAGTLWRLAIAKAMRLPVTEPR